MWNSGKMTGMGLARVIVPCEDLRMGLSDVIIPCEGFRMGLFDAIIPCEDLRMGLFDAIIPCEDLRMGLSGMIAPCGRPSHSSRTSVSCTRGTVITNIYLKIIILNKFFLNIINMKEIITRINLHGLKNETHVQFNEEADSVFVKHNPQTLGIYPLYVPYKAALNNEYQALDYIGKSELTKKIIEQDRKRDNIYRGFVDSLKGAAKHFDLSHRDAANLLLNIFDHYGNIARKTLDDETAAINDLARELEQPKLTQAIALLGMNAWLNKLVEENNAFEELMKERYSETASKTSFRMRAVRVETDKYYHAIISQIENQCLADIEINENFIKELNAVIERFKRILAQEIGERKPKTINNE
jgi:hypothetical protein